MSKIAVIYWSGTGNTQQMAEAIANQAHADLFTASEFSPEKAANYDAFAFGCSAMGAEQLEEDEFEPMWNAVAPVLGSKKVVLFGSLGGTLGMFCFHHKTRHWYFRYGFPILLVVQLLLLGAGAYLLLR